MGGTRESFVKAYFTTACRLVAEVLRSRNGRFWLIVSLVMTLFSIVRAEMAPLLIFLALVMLLSGAIVVLSETIDSRRRR